MDEETLTDFGYQQVSAKEKTKRVENVFHSVANNYDLMNDLMSLGIHRLWKRMATQLLEVHATHTVLDLAGGTGDLSALLGKKIHSPGKIILADINASMLAQGRMNLENRGLLNKVDYLQLNAEQLPFAENTFDRIIIAFGLRNVTDKSLALQQMARVLKPGGRAFILEFSKPKSKTLSAFYDKYSFSILPKLGEIIANDKSSYQYLAESIRQHPDQVTLKNMILAAGFEDCDYLNFLNGIVALHRAYKY